MLWSKLFIPTLRENPVEAEAPSHRLLLRAGYIRQADPGTYTYLYLAQRSLLKIQRIVRAEMNAIGAQEFLLPVLESGGHEDIVTAIARGELRSYKQLPQIWYQIQTRFREEPRQKSDPLRARQFLMMDSYSFDADARGLDVSYEKHYEASRRIFTRCGLRVIATATDFMVPSDAGDDAIVQCGACGYVASLDYAVSNATVPPLGDPEGDRSPEEFHTPGRKTIAEVSEFTQLPPASQIKSLVMVADGKPLLALLRGDHQMSRPKLASIMGAREVRPAQLVEINIWFGADPGSLGPVGVIDIRIIADHALSGRRNMIAGANRDNYHLRNVTPGRDFEAEFADIRRVCEGDRCASCDGELNLESAIEAAHLRKQTGSFTGSYGIGIERILCSAIEQNNDEAGMFLPAAIAPFEVIVTPVNNADASLRDAAQEIYSDCVASGIDVLYDDRDERPGAKFKDADLIGVPYRITLGKKLAQGLVELTERSTRTSGDIAVPDVISELKRRLTAC